MRSKNVGHPLAALLTQCLGNEGLTVSKLAVELGVSQSYLSELLAGDKAFSKLDDEFVRSISAYLQIPAVVGLLLAGKLKHQDFVDRPLELNEQLKEAMVKVARSSYALESAVSPLMLMQLPAEVQLLLILVFQDATGNSVIPQRRWPWTQAIERHA